MPSVARHALPLPSGDETARLVMSNGAGLSATVLGVGASLIDLRWCSDDESSVPLVLGLEHPEQYAGPHPYLGSTVGRFANRIAAGRFSLDGVPYQLDRNDGESHLHGGAGGFHHRLFTAETFVDERCAGVRFSLISEHAEDGYPGRLEVDVTYRLMRTGVMRIDYRASCDRPTVLNLTHHSYFNLHDGGASDVLGHELWIAAQEMLEVDDAGIVTGRVLSVNGTPFDFSRPQPIGDRIARVTQRKGYDHCYVQRSPSGTLELAARLRDPPSARALEVWTTQPALQLYSGNFLDSTLVGSDGRRYGKHAGVCLETQGYCDAPNHPHFPSARISPSAPYVHAVEYRFELATNPV